MLQQLINHSPDLNKLQEDGYRMEVRGGLLLVHHVPYVTTKREVKNGSMVCSLNLASPSRTGQPNDHTMHFIGETPCSSDGSPLIAIINNSNKQTLAEGIVANHYFSSKPKPSGRYKDYYEKVRTYAEILSSQAKALDSSVTARPDYKKQLK